MKNTYWKTDEFFYLQKIYGSVEKIIFILTTLVFVRSYYFDFTSTDVVKITADKTQSASFNLNNEANRKRHKLNH